MTTLTASGVIAPLVLFWIVRGTPLKFLFERPAWASLRPAPRRGLVAAEQTGAIAAFPRN